MITSCWFSKASKSYTDRRFLAFFSCLISPKPSIQYLRFSLLEVLRHLGFGMAWCSLVLTLLSSSSTRILLNGEPGQLIQHQRGLRQGDPLSPMLFIIVMDVLNSLFVKAGSEGLLQPLSRRKVFSVCR